MLPKVVGEGRPVITQDLYKSALASAANRGGAFARAGAKMLKSQPTGGQEGLEPGIFRQHFCSNLSAAIVFFADHPFASSPASPLLLLLPLRLQLPLAVTSLQVIC